VDVVGLEERQVKQLLHGRRGQRLVLLDAEGRQPVPGLGRDHDARATRGDDVAELLEHERRTVQVDLEDRLRRRLRRGDASGMNQSHELPQTGGLLDERMNGLAVGRVDRRDATRPDSSPAPATSTQPERPPPSPQAPAP
jgi:hypothetical protein